MDSARHHTVAFTGHRAYSHEATDALCTTVAKLYEQNFRTFLSGMAVGFDLAAAEAVLACRASMPGLRLVAVIPFRGHDARFSPADRDRFLRIVSAADETVILSDAYHRACYYARNDYLVDHASLLVAWYDGSPGGTQYTVRRAVKRGLEIRNLAAGEFRPLPGGLF